MHRPAHLALSRMLEVDRGWICNRQEQLSMLSGHKQKCGPQAIEYEESGYAVMVRVKLVDGCRGLLGCATTITRKRQRI